MRRTRGAVLAGVVALLLWGEWANWSASRRLVPGAPGVREAVVVPGYRNRGDRANVVNRWRVRAGIRSTRPDRTHVLVLSGGSVAGRASEAGLMAAYARQQGYRGAIVLEERSRTTWENVANVATVVEGCDAIRIASHPLHGLKARVYLRRQRPDLAARLVRADDYRFGEWVALKPLLAAYGVWSLRRIPRSERR